MQLKWLFVLAALILAVQSSRIHKRDVEGVEPEGGDGNVETPTGGEGEVPSEGGDVNPTEGESEVPSGGEDGNPNDGESEVPSGGEGESPSGGESGVTNEVLFNKWIDRGVALFDKAYTSQAQLMINVLVWLGEATKYGIKFGSGTSLEGMRLGEEIIKALEKRGGEKIQKVLLMIRKCIDTFMVMSTKGPQALQNYVKGICDKLLSAADKTGTAANLGLQNSAKLGLQVIAAWTDTFRVIQGDLPTVIETVSSALQEKITANVQSTKEMVNKVTSAVKNIVSKFPIFGWRS